MSQSEQQQQTNASGAVNSSSPSEPEEQQRRRRDRVKASAVSSQLRAGNFIAEVQAYAALAARTLSGDSPWQSATSPTDPPGESHTQAQYSYSSKRSHST